MASNSDVGDLTFASACRVVALHLRRATLRPPLPDVDAGVARALPRSTPALRLLLRYLRILQDRQPPDGSALERMVVTHVHDLLVIAFGPTDDAENARERAVRAATLQAVKAEILANLHRSDLSVNEIAARFRLRPRHLQRLFENEGATFTDFILCQRLTQTHRLLSDPRCTRSITTVAFEAGFNDLSYINRTFRRQFGCTPSEARAKARIDGG
jgi:AraC-like DNA-binding protein